VSEPGIESRIAELVGSKKAFLTGLFDGTTDEMAFERSGGFLSRIERIVAPTISPAPVRAEDAAVSDDDDVSARSRRLWRRATSQATQRSHRWPHLT
jgi:hypothetical protein